MVKKNQNKRPSDEEKAPELAEEVSVEVPKKKSKKQQNLESKSDEQDSLAGAGVSKRPSRAAKYQGSMNEVQLSKEKDFANMEEASKMIQNKPMPATKSKIKPVLKSAPKSKKSSEEATDEVTTKKKVSKSKVVDKQNEDDDAPTEKTKKATKSKADLPAKAKTGKTKGIANGNSAAVEVEFCSS